MAKKTKKRPKRRSAAQKRASKKNIRKAQASRRRNKPKTKRKSKRSNNKKKNTKRSMAKGKSKKSFIDKIPILKNPTVQKIGFGLGMGVVVIKAIDLIASVAPASLAAPLVQNKRIIQLGVEAVTEPLSAIVDVATGGGLGSLGNIVGGNKQQSAMSNGGFA